MNSPCWGKRDFFSVVDQVKGIVVKSLEAARSACIGSAIQKSVYSVCRRASAPSLLRERWWSNFVCEVAIAEDCMRLAILSVFYVCVWWAFDSLYPCVFRNVRVLRFRSCSSCESCSAPKGGVAFVNCQVDLISRIMERKGRLRMSSYDEPGVVGRSWFEERTRFLR